MSAVLEEVTPSARAAQLEMLARQLRWNPYYLAYAFDTDCEDPDAAFVRDGSNLRYLDWNMKRWEETAKRIKVKRNDPELSFRVVDHMETLATLPSVIAAMERRLAR